MECGPDFKDDHTLAIYFKSQVKLVPDLHRRPSFRHEFLHDLIDPL